MRRIGRGRQVAARELVLALRAGLDARELVLRSRIRWPGSSRARNAGTGGARSRPSGGRTACREPMKLMRARDVAPGALGHHQQDAGRASSRRSARRTRASDRAGPICASRCPCRRRRRRPSTLSVRSRAGQPFAPRCRLPAPPALAPDGLALARGERGEEIVEGCVARVLPVELLVGALQEAALAEQAPFVFGEEGDVHARRRRCVCASSTSASASAPADRVGCRAGRAPAGARPVAGVNGTATCSFG